MLGKAIISDYFSQNRCADNLRPYVPLLPDILSWNNQKSHVPFTFQPDFPKTFGKRQTTIIADFGTSHYAGRRICSKRPVYSLLLSCVSVLLGILLSKNYASNNDFNGTLIHDTSK